MSAIQNLPIRLAIVAAAGLHFESDVRQGRISSSSWEDEKMTYLALAEKDLEQKGMQPPFSPEDPQIVVDNRADCSADMAVQFLDAIDVWQQRRQESDAMGTPYTTPFPSPLPFYKQPVKTPEGQRRESTRHSPQPTQLLGGAGA